MHTHHHPNRALSVKELEARRLKAGRYFDQGKTAYFVEQKFFVSSTTAREWRTRWKQGTLKAQPQGSPAKLTTVQKKALVKRILKGPSTQGYATELWTLERMTDLIWQTEQVRYRPRSVWHLMQALGFSCQRPARRAKERNERHIQQWRQQAWPGLQKKGLA
jgi:transposase